MWKPDLFLKKTWSSIILSADTKVFEFQKDGNPSSSSVAFKILQPEDFQQEFVTEFSVCAWFQINQYKYTQQPIYLFSYSISDLFSNELNLAICK